MKDLEELNEEELGIKLNENLHGLVNKLDGITLTGRQYRDITNNIKDIVVIFNQIELLRGEDEEH